MRIGIFCLPLSGHLYPLMALARKLRERKHEVVFFGLPDTAALFRDDELAFIPYAELDCPLGFVAQTWAPIARLQGLAVMQQAMTVINPQLLQLTLTHLPERVCSSGVEAMITDAAFTFSELVPLALGLPFVQVWTILHPDFSATTPPCVTSRPNEQTPAALTQNAHDMQELGRMIAASVPVAATYAEQHQLPINWQQPGATSSKLAVLTQTPRLLDFPNLPWQGQFQYTGPLLDYAGRTADLVDWQQLDGRLLIYASLGTLNNGLLHMHRAILEAVATLPEVQVVFAIGHTINPAELGPVPANALVVPEAPQLDLLKRASLCLTHAGLNTVLEALSEGVPLVALPVGYDQPGVAARVAYHGVGEFIDAADIRADNLRECLMRVLHTPSYRERAKQYQQALRGISGPTIAADIIEAAFSVTVTA